MHTRTANSQARGSPAGILKQSSPPTFPLPSPPHTHTGLPPRPGSSSSSSPMLPPSAHEHAHGPTRDRGGVMYCGKLYRCYECGAYTVYARGTKLLLFKTVYSKRACGYVTLPPIEARMRLAPHGCHIDVIRR
ncbi:hypothetical protein IWQ57_001150 [Coemansia nantahalensis]|uniref:Uncharacterized protein n=2 Tax=Coemansia TaxID=4863 RepID=A0ACC1LCP7_9FUNG|nr:hypothetical protein IWQ57_001150 [Coemansia nantahalensis]KAJ2806037.1 hypothetical protein H4R21_001034 [Coemansia helicoidea]